ncbi:MAG: hypothetical protein V4676_09900 [Bacteroidota bacterium]
MKPVFSIMLFICCLAANAQVTNSKYDKALADSLNADEYGMKMYVLVILKTGSNTTASKSTSDSLFGGHMQNIKRMVADGKLAVAGPLKKNEKNYRGIFILNVKTVDEANLLLANDPAISAKLLDAEVYSWYGSAALPMYLPASDKIGKKSF